jgi:hypothetical protein
VRRLAWLPLVVLAAAPDAAAQDFSASVTPERFQYGMSRQVSWRIEVRTGDQPASFRISLAPAGAGPRLLTLDPVRVRLEGTGTLTLLSERNPPACGSPRVLSPRDVPESGGEFSVALPAGAASAIVVPAVAASMPPWAPTTYGLSARVVAGDSAPRELALPVAVPDDRFLGLPVVIRTTPASIAPACGAAPRSHLAGGEVRVQGRTDASARGGTATLVAASPASRREQEVRRAPVGGDGSFRFRGWRPHQIGVWEVAVRVAGDPSRSRAHVDDFSAPLQFRVRAGPVRAPGVRSTGFVAVANGSSEVVVTCPPKSARCRGTVRFSDRKRRIAGSPFSVPPGATGTAVLHVPRADRPREGQRVVWRLEWVSRGARRGARRVVLRGTGEGETGSAPAFARVAR